MGYVGPQPAWEIVLSGLRRLEYRGYDSAGVVTVAEGKFNTSRAVGNIKALEKVTPNGLPGHVGIGHTRWATHGGVTEANCHPHKDSSGRIAVVHNGIVDNADPLRKALQAEGVVFQSETDTEIIAEIIGREVNAGASLTDAVRTAMQRIDGTAGIVVIDQNDPTTLVGARIGSPVVIGLGDGESWIASDPLAICPFTDRMVVLEDGEVATLTTKGFQTVDLDNRDRAKRIEKIEHSAEAADKGDFAHFMLKEIFEQPQAIDRSIRGRLNASTGTSRLGGLRSHLDALRNVQRVVFFGCGTSLYSGEVGSFLMSRYGRIPSESMDAAELTVRNPIVDSRTLYVAISQSGETADTLAALREIRLKGGLVAGITNVAGSSLARESDFGTYVHAGPEISVCSTKAFTAQVIGTQLLALQFARMHDMGEADGRDWVRALERLPNQIAEMLKSADTCAKVADRFAGSKFTMFVGRGANVAVAAEGALKLKEVAYVPAEGLSGAAMKHGPLALIEKDLPVWALVPPDDTRDRMIGNLRELQARGANITAVGSAEDSELSELADTLIPLPPHHPAVSPLLTVIPLQLYAYYVALKLGHDIDRPRNLAKSVTVM
jgi:glucosamine--fructose-6-phosphate aminotransferase (isomerizing)